MLKWGRDWRGFLTHIAKHRDKTELDQWEFQMHCRVLERIGVEKLWFVSDGLKPDVQQQIAVNAILDTGDAQKRAQRAIDQFVAAHPQPSIAVIPDGPYTMLRAR